MILIVNGTLTVKAFCSQSEGRRKEFGTLADRRIEMQANAPIACIMVFGPCFESWSKYHIRSRCPKTGCVFRTAALYISAVRRHRHVDILHIRRRNAGYLARKQDAKSDAEIDTSFDADDRRRRRHDTTEGQNPEFAPPLYHGHQHPPTSLAPPFHKIAPRL